VSAPCSEAFQQLAERLGGIDCATANPVVSFRAPWALENWTLPVVELLTIGGAALGLAQAIVLRRRGQAQWLCAWIATVIYVLALEPFLYFPDEFGLESSVGLTFAHNVFSVEFLYDRLPLYIVALYPAGIYLAHQLVDRLGVFARHGILVGAVATGIVHHAFYEVFDQLGPQLRWWAWNADAAGTGPFFASVPMSSMVLFAAITPALATALARRFLFAERSQAWSTRTWVWRTAAAGLLTPVLMPIVSMPVTIVDSDEHPGLSKTIHWIALGLMAAVAIHGITTSRVRAETAPGLAGRYPFVHGAAFIATFLVLWATALPQLLDADGGFTDEGTPIGSPLYALVCGGFCTYVVLRSRSGARTATTSPRPTASTTFAAGLP
jgi:hypothetical protein